MEQFYRPLPPKAKLSVSIGLFGYSHKISDTSALTPALSPKRGRIGRCFIENLDDWIGRTLIRKTRNSRKRFPLPGERIKGEGGRKHSYL